MNNHIADSTDKGSLSIYHVKRLWSKLVYKNAINQNNAKEAALDNALMDILGIGYLPTYTFVYQQNPSFADFEKWICTHYPDGEIPISITEQCNTLFNDEKKEEAIIVHEPVLSETDLLHWHELGYTIVRNAISPEDCKATRDLIWAHLGMDENNPASWYQSHEAIQGIMVALFNHPQIHKNRHAPRIRKAYEQIWGTNNLIVTSDKVGFNPPETPTYIYKGIGLHFDTSLAQPIPFGTQGILYLTDTATHQGALTVVPGFHHTIHNWLEELAPDKNPREENLAAFGTKAIAANAGDFIIWHHCLPHSASANRAATPRLVQYMNWYDPFVEKQSEWL